MKEMEKNLLAEQMKKDLQENKEIYDAAHENYKPDYKSRTKTAKETLGNRFKDAESRSISIKTIRDADRIKSVAKKKGIFSKAVAETNAYYRMEAETKKLREDNAASMKESIESLKSKQEELYFGVDADTIEICGEENADLLSCFSDICDEEMMRSYGKLKETEGAADPAAIEEENKKTLESRNEVMDVLTDRMLSYSPKKFRDMSDENIVRETAAFEQMSASVQSFNAILSQNPQYVEKLQTEKTENGRNKYGVLMEHVRTLSVISDYYRVRKLILTDPEYIKSQNDIDFNITDTDSEQTARLKELLRVSLHLSARVNSLSGINMSNISIGEATHETARTKNLKSELNEIFSTHAGDIEKNQDRQQLIDNKIRQLEQGDNSLLRCSEKKKVIMKKMAAKKQDTQIQTAEMLKTDEEKYYEHERHNCEVFKRPVESIKKLKGHYRPDLVGDIVPWITAVTKEEIAHNKRITLDPKKIVSDARMIENYEKSGNFDRTFGGRITRFAKLVMDIDLNRFKLDDSFYRDFSKNYEALRAMSALKEVFEENKKDELAYRAFLVDMNNSGIDPEAVELKLSICKQILTEVETGMKKGFPKMKYDHDPVADYQGPIEKKKAESTSVLKDMLTKNAKAFQEAPEENTDGEPAERYKILQKFCAETISSDLSEIDGMSNEEVIKYHLEFGNMISEMDHKDVKLMLDELYKRTGDETIPAEEREYIKRSLDDCVAKKKEVIKERLINNKVTEIFAGMSATKDDPAFSEDEKKLLKQLMNESFGHLDNYYRGQSNVDVAVSHYVNAFSDVMDHEITHGRYFTKKGEKLCKELIETRDVSTIENPDIHVLEVDGVEIKFYAEIEQLSKYMNDGTLTIRLKDESKKAEFLEKLDKIRLQLDEYAAKMDHYSSGLSIVKNEGLPSVEGSKYLVSLKDNIGKQIETLFLEYEVTDETFEANKPLSELGYARDICEEISILAKGKEDVSPELLSVIKKAKVLMSAGTSDMKRTRAMAELLLAARHYLDENDAPETSEDSDDTYRTCERLLQKASTFYSNAPAVYARRLQSILNEKQSENKDATEVKEISQQLGYLAGEEYVTLRESQEFLNQSEEKETPEVKRIVELMEGVSSITATPMPKYPGEAAPEEEKKRFSQEVFDGTLAVTRVYDMLVEGCNSYLKTGKNEAVLDHVKTIKSRILHTRKVFANSITGFLAGHIPDGSTTWAEAIAAKSGQLYDISQKETKILGEGTSTVYQMKKDQENIYFKKDDKTATDPVKAWEMVKSNVKSMKGYSPDFDKNLEELFKDMEEAFEAYNEAVKDKDQELIGQIEHDLYQSFVLGAMSKSGKNFLKNYGSDRKARYNYPVIGKLYNLSKDKVYGTFVNSLITEFVKTFNAYYFGAAAGIAPGVVLSKRNVATSRMANLMGIDHLVMRSETADVMENGQMITGTLMEEARGSEAYKIYSEKEKNTRYTTQTVNDLLTMHVFDIICGQVDRNPKNFFLKKENGLVSSLMMIDNDMAFGLSKGENLTKAKYLNLPAIDMEVLVALPKEVKEKVHELATSPIEFYQLVFGDLINKKEIAALKKRAEYMDAKIREEMKKLDEEAKNDKDKAFLKDNLDDPEVCALYYQKILHDQAEKNTKYDNDVYIRQHSYFSSEYIMTKDEVEAAIRSKQSAKKKK